MFSITSDTMLKYLQIHFLSPSKPVLCSGAHSKHGWLPEPVRCVPHTSMLKYHMQPKCLQKEWGTNIPSRANRNIKEAQRTNSKRWWERPLLRDNTHRARGSQAQNFSWELRLHKYICLWLPSVPGLGYRYCFINTTCPQVSTWSTTNSSPSAHLEHTIN